MNKEKAIYFGDPTGKREYTFGHKYFSTKKSRDPDSARQPPSFDSLSQRSQSDIKIARKNLAIFNRVTLRGIEPRLQP